MNQPPDDLPRQLPLGFAIAPGFTADDLVATSSNRAAIRMVEAWPAWPAPVVVLSGPEGSGKSHLATFWKQRSEATLLKAEKIPPPGMQARPVFLIEDADQGTLDETGLFHLINFVRSAGGSLLMTSRRPPATWNVQLPDLASRLRAAALVEIDPPDDRLLTAVIFKLFADRQVEIGAQVVAYLVQRMHRSLADAIRLVEHIDALSLERRCRITRALAAEALATFEDEGEGRSS